MAAPSSVSPPRSTRLLHRRESGQAVVELALILPILVLITMAIVDLGRIFYTYEALANASREGARYWALNPDQAANTQRRATHELSCDSGTTPSVCATLGFAISSPDAACPNTQKGCPVTVTVTSNFSLLTPFMARVLNPDPTCAGSAPPNDPILRKVINCSPVDTMTVRASATMVVW